ncbi:glycine cleavage system transcriptional repressor [Azospirillum fermentarium]|uniref:glycine cleavage system protein R n=1 Tax=Azospirillum fermentarium TaxID=1233114 RepID=UPI002227EB42|nr:ACT domain-containing protein [Azospirillum fermentarium]MCW2248761.1 glycine cleavage system transcriptional repressor [Azospirillum fermentarium]
MTKSTESVALVSVLGPDRVGLVSAVTGALFEQGVNLRDVSFAALGQGADFSAVCELPDGLTVAALTDSLSALTELDGARLTVTPFTYDPNPGPLGLVTHRIEVSGGDQPGLIARLSEIFTQSTANIVRLEAQTLPGGEDGRYVIRFAVSLPPDRADACLSAVANTAEMLGLTCTVQAG